MHIRDSKYVRLTSILLAVALAIMSMPLQAAWQCPDGTPCPSNCLMLHSSSSPTHHAVMPCCAHGVMPGCPLCASSTGTKVVSKSVQKSTFTSSSSRCTSSVCVQKQAKAHTFVVTGAIHSYLPSTHIMLMEYNIQTHPFIYINPLLHAISRTYRPPPSRAPPTF